MIRPLRRVLPLLAVATFVLGGCFGGADPTPSPSAEPSAIPSIAASPSEAAAPASAPPSSQPTEAAESATAAPSFGGGGGFSVAPNPEADALFIERDECTNRQDGYQLEFPEDWWTNTEIARFPACVWFSPTFYEVTDEAQVPQEIAITIEWIAGGIGRADGADIVTREDVVVGGQAASRVEWTDDSYWYAIQLGPTPEEGPNLLAVTAVGMGGDYELNKAVLDRIMSTIEFIGTTQ